jgi:hypothetical protein
MGFFAKKKVSYVASTILVVWSSLDHSKDNSEIPTSFSNLTIS